MDNKTIKTYSNLATDYDQETKDFWERFPNTIIDAFVKALPNGGRILDVGSGPGRDALILKESGLDVLCLDASEAMVSMCREKKLEAIVGDFLDLPFGNEKFDGVWAYTSLLHVKKIEIDKALKEIYRVLKPSGTFGLGIIEGDKELYRESSGMNMERWFSFYTKKEIENLLEKHSFKIIFFNEFMPKSKKYLNFIAQKINS